MMIAAVLIPFTLLCLAMGRNLSWSNETRRERNMLVFQHRNRHYGAYRLRTGYDRRLGLAFLAAVGILGLIVSVAKAVAHFQPQVQVPATGEVVVDVDLGRAFIFPPEPPQPAPGKREVLPPVKRDPDELRPVDATDSLVEPPLPPRDTSSMAAVQGNPSTSRSGGTAVPGGGTGGDAGPDIEAGASTWEGFEVQEVPQFPGGEKALHQWVQRNLEFPPDAFGKDVVYVQFIIGLNGSVEDVQAVKGEQEALRNAAERTLRRMPRWKPARMNGHEVRCRLTLPIRFETR